MLLLNIAVSKRQVGKPACFLMENKYAYVLTLIGLSGSLVVKQVWGESGEVIHIFGIDFR